jgi:hypothetical protein
MSNVQTSEPAPGESAKTKQSDRVVAFETDFLNLCSRILSRLLHRELRAGLHQGMLSWLLAWLTGTIRKTARLWSFSRTFRNSGTTPEFVM